MTQFIAGNIAWTEIVGSVPFSERRLASAARRYFEPTKFMNAGNQDKRALIRGLIDTAFDPNYSILDVAHRVGDEIRDSTAAKSLETCIAKIWMLGEEGWHRSGSEIPNRFYSCDGLRVQLAPDAVLEHGGKSCFIYTYFRKSPVLSTDGVRTLIALNQALSERGAPGADRIIVLDCFKDAFYEDTEFQTGENWIANRIAAVFGGYAEAFKRQQDASAPHAVTRPDSILAAASLAHLHDGNAGLSDEQLSFRLH